MTLPITVSAGKAPKIVATRIVALHDPQTGRIRHVHTVHMYEGAREISQEQAMEQALHHARTLGLDVEKLAVKHSCNAEHGHLPHRIDLETGAFVAMESPIPVRGR